MKSRTSVSLSILCSACFVLSILMPCKCQSLSNDSTFNLPWFWPLTNSPKPWHWLFNVWASGENWKPWHWPYNVWALWEKVLVFNRCNPYQKPFLCKAYRPKTVHFVRGTNCWRTVRPDNSFFFLQNGQFEACNLLKTLHLSFKE